MTGLTGLAYVRHRDYSPRLGRFIQRDPLGFEAGDNNWYRFVGNGPTGRTDPSGLDISGGVITISGCNPTITVITPNAPPYHVRPESPGVDIRFDSCVARCIAANGGVWALAALGVSTAAGGTLPKPFGAGALGAGCVTTAPSLIQHFTGLGVRQLGRRLNPIMNALQVAAASYLVGASASCAAICSHDNRTY